MDPCPAVPDGSRTRSPGWQTHDVTERIAVDDPDEPRVAVFVGLRDQALRGRREAAGGDLAGLFIAEGDLVVERADRAGYRLRALLLDATRTKPLPVEPVDGVPVYAGGPDVIRRITGLAVHRGVMGCFERRPVPDAETVLDGVRRVVVCENVANPTNLGLVARSASALGVDALLLDPTSCDPLYRRASRVSMGEVYARPTVDRSAARRPGAPVRPRVRGRRAHPGPDGRRHRRAGLRTRGPGCARAGCRRSRPVRRHAGRRRPPGADPAPRRGRLAQRRLRRRHRLLRARAVLSAADLRVTRPRGQRCRPARASRRGTTLPDTSGRIIIGRCRSPWSSRPTTRRGRSAPRWTRSCGLPTRSPTSRSSSPPTAVATPPRTSPARMASRCSISPKRPRRSRSTPPTSPPPRSRACTWTPTPAPPPP